jgi:hypothetical protein
VEYLTPVIGGPWLVQMRRPLKGVLKRREVKAPEDMTAAELKEHLIAYGVRRPHPGPSIALIALALTIAPPQNKFAL